LEADPSTSKNGGACNFGGTKTGNSAQKNKRRGGNHVGVPVDSCSAKTHLRREKARCFHVKGERRKEGKGLNGLWKVPSSEKKAPSPGYVVRKKILG